MVTCQRIPTPAAVAAQTISNSAVEYRIMLRCLSSCLVAVALIVVPLMPAQACSPGTIQVGLNWVSNQCAKGRDADCADVAKSVVRTLRSCRGLKSADVDRAIREVQRLSAGTGARANQEADRRYRERMAPDPGRAERLNREGARSACYGNVGVQCAAICGGDIACHNQCTGQNAWRCN
jgi:hypothetical protein